MIAVDTKVLVRLLVDDNPTQHRASARLFASEDIFISDTVLLESEWVLRAVYKLTPHDVCSAIRRICGLRNVSVIDARRIAQVVDWHEAGLDFADAFHLAQSENQETFKTFDSDFIKKARKITARAIDKP